MNIDKTLKNFAENLGEPAFDVEAGRERLRQAVHRLREDPLEGQRIDYIAERLDRCEKAYRLAHEALQRQDYSKAEHYFRGAAEHGNDEAAYWLALLLEMRSTRQRLKGRIKKAGKLAAEAREWRFRAQESGIAEALDAARASDAPPAASRPMSPRKPQGDRGQQVGRVRVGVTAPHARPLPAPPDRYAVGIELLPYEFTIVLINRYGDILASEVRDLADMEAGAVVPVFADAAREIVASTLGPRFPADQVVLGVQLGGPIDTETGTVHYFSKHPPMDYSTTEFLWESFPLGPRLQQETGFRTAVLNDAVAFAEREQWLGVGPMTGDFVVLLVREGVGGAVVTNGDHFKGPVEIGNFSFSSNSFETSDVGQLGVLELTGGITGIIKSASKFVPGRLITDIETAAAVASEEGPGRAADAAFLSAGVAIACGLSYLVQFAGPSHVVLYAPEAMLRSDRHASRAFLAQVSKFKEAVSFEAFKDCELVLRPEGRTDGAQGAALAGLNRCFRIMPATSSTSTGAMR